LEDKVTFMVRPKEIALDQQPGAKGEIDREIYLGDAIEYIVTLGGAPLRVRTDATFDLSTGIAVSLRFGDHRFFSYHTGDLSFQVVFA
jgi:hypothetical protein